MSLNKPPTDDAAASSRWTGTPSWYLWDGGFIALGRTEGITPPHEHHAIQIVIAVEGAVGIRGKRATGGWLQASSSGWFSLVQTDRWSSSFAVLIDPISLGKSSPYPSAMRRGFIRLEEVRVAEQNSRPRKHE